ncbi:aspartyl/asparaginyl beta-hydroxylase domain-containing protein [Rhodospirillum sp. A1_3_36]|uniref:aspartyl/asparaginyl beta-hydroxylase domain-containing protein n=1 Tax=Rhodospirillum sp. A1_3_36 TaxID=3391666 RepID=UPI0039A60CC7
MTLTDHKAKNGNRMDGDQASPGSCRVPPPLPWHEILAGSGLTLHAPLGPTLDAEILQREFAQVDQMVEMGNREFFNHDGSWSGITLIDRASANGGPGIDRPTLALMPFLARYIAESGWHVLGCSLMRLPPGGVLAWHYERQSPLFAESRLILPIHAPSGAATLIADMEIAYPAGQTWIGDFSFPHQVENHSDTQRIVVAIDVKNTPAFLNSLPPELIDQPQKRQALAQDAINALLSWWAINPTQQRAYPPPDKTQSSAR